MVCLQRFSGYQTRVVRKGDKSRKHTKHLTSPVHDNTNKIRGGGEASLNFRGHRGGIRTVTVKKKKSTCGRARKSQCLRAFVACNREILVLASKHPNRRPPGSSPHRTARTESRKATSGRAAQPPHTRCRSFSARFPSAPAFRFRRVYDFIPPPGSVLCRFVFELVTARLG